MIEAAEASSLLDALHAAGCAIAGPRKGGVRNLLEKAASVRTLADSPAIRRLVEPVLGKAAFPSRAILFDKTPDANWKVPWHQDLSIAVQRRIEVPSFGPWTMKDGVQYVQPPTLVLDCILAVRIHLDHCGAENGPVRVIPGSHTHGRLSADAIQSMVECSTPVVCTMDRGDALVMRPLLLHASSAAASSGHRRVLHLEFAAHELPGGLRWHSAA